VPLRGEGGREAIMRLLGRVGIDGQPVRETVADHPLERRRQRTAGALQIAFTAFVIRLELGEAGEQQVPPDGDAQEDQEELGRSIHGAVCVMIVSPRRPERGRPARTGNAGGTPALRAPRNFVYSRAISCGPSPMTTGRASLPSGSSTAPVPGCAAQKSR